ncbi:DNA sulfur modification protein DndE [Paenibacillus sp. DP01]|uniref:DNA sulfur modification protein DndE n=1 Tax=Paenibacillus sp. DP01 TaxID=3373096 RepID=UPI00384A8286
MNFRLKTSKSTAEKLKLLNASTGLTPNILARYAVCLSLRDPQPITKLVKDMGGIEFNRNTLTGEYDFIFKALIAQHESKNITDEEFFPDLFNAHLERGIRILASEYNYAGNSEKLILNLIHVTKEGHAQ